MRKEEREEERKGREEKRKNVEVGRATPVIKLYGVTIHIWIPRYWKEEVQGKRSDIPTASAWGRSSDMMYTGGTIT